MLVNLPLVIRAKEKLLTKCVIWTTTVIVVLEIGAVNRPNQSKILLLLIRNHYTSPVPYLYPHQARSFQVPDHYCIVDYDPR